MLGRRRLRYALLDKIKKNHDIHGSLLIEWHPIQFIIIFSSAKGRVTSYSNYPHTVYAVLFLEHLISYFHITLSPAYTNNRDKGV